MAIVQEMMPNDNVTALVEYMTPARRGFVIAMEEMFNRLQYNEHELDVANATASNYERESIDSADLVVKLYYDHAVKLLLSAGVRPTEGIEFVTLGQLAEAVFDLDRPHNQDIVVDALNDELDPEQTLARLLGEITEDSEVRWYPHLLNVDDALVARLRNLSANEELIDEYNQEASDIKVIYGRFKESYNPPIMSAIVGRFEQLPIAPEPVLRSYSDSMGLEVTQSTSEEIVAIAILAGGVTESEVTEMTTDYLNRFFEPSYAIMAMAKIQAIVTEVF